MSALSKTNFFLLQPAAILLAVAMLAGSGCYQSPSSQGFKNVFIEGGTPASQKTEDKVTAEARKFFVSWLEDHSETEIINDDTGVGVAASETRLWAFLCGSQSKDNSTTMEVEFRIVLPDGREIQDFVAGYGDDEKQAMGMAFLNYTLSTFHTVYSCFVNENDPHLEHEEVTVNGRKMLYTTSGTFALGPDVEDQFGDISEKIKQAITGLELPDQVHWFKIVYGQNEGKVITVAATLNNDEHKLLTNKISNLNWPVEDSFYLAKQFVILRPAKDE